MYPLRVGRGHQGAEGGEVVVHLAAAIPLHRDMSHPLALHLLLVLQALAPPPLAP